MGLTGRLLLIDGHSILSRAFYGVPDLTTSKGVHTNAVYGFLNIMLKAIEDEACDHAAVAFDLERAKLRRTKLYPAYKGTRKPMPEELHEQVPLMQEMLRAMHLPILTLEGYEADDILGTIAKRCAKEGAEVTILSGDRDLLQLADTHIKISIPKTSKGRTELFQYYPEDVVREYGVTPQAFIDVKALQGDTSDNIPGLPGVGPKTATAIITQFGSLAEAKAHMDEIKPPKAQKAMREHWELAELSRALSEIDIQAPVSFDYDSAGIDQMYTQESLALCREFEFKSLIPRFAKGVEEAGRTEAAPENTSVSLDALKAFSDPYMAEVIFGDASLEKTISLSIFSERTKDGSLLHVAAGLCLAKDRLYAVYSSPSYPAETLAGDLKALAAKLAERGVRVYTMDLKAALKVLEVARASCFYDLGVAAYLLNPLKDSYDYADLARDYAGAAAESPSELFGKTKLFDALAEADALARKEQEAARNEALAKTASIGVSAFAGGKTSAKEEETAQGSEMLKAGSLQEASGDAAEASGSAAMQMEEETAEAASQETPAHQGKKLHPAFRFLGYAAYVPYLTGQPLMKALKEEKCLSLYEEIELPLIYSLNDMETAGIRLDEKTLDAYAKQLQTQITGFEQEIYAQAGEQFNINSPSQLGRILFEKLGLKGGKKTKTGYSTAADVLNKLAPEYPIVSHILRYRALTKLYSTYAAGLPAYVVPADGRIHGTFTQTITATGRISSKDPNLQNIPVRTAEGKEIRKVFVPADGFLFVDADYSQVELRILAALSGDEKLIKAYRDAVDIHRLTASEVFHVPLDEVTDEMRRNAKAVNFGIVYGISAFGLGEDLSISRKEAQDYINRYFETYPKVKTYLDGEVALAKEHGAVRTAFGRIRPVPEIRSSNFMTRSFGERVAMNSPIQGTAADIMKLAMNRVNMALSGLSPDGKQTGKRYRSRIVLQVHDELLVETAPEEKEAVMALLRENMIAAGEKNQKLRAVSLSVDVKAGENWYECH